MVNGKKCLNCKTKDIASPPSTNVHIKEWCGDCIQALKNTSKGTKCDICNKAISEDTFINLEGTEPKLAPYDKEKDWLIHPSCFTTADNEKYKGYQLGKCYEVVVIYGWKKQAPPEKCADCQQEKGNLVEIKENNKTIKICSECKQKRDDKPTELKNCSKCGKIMPSVITQEMKEKKMCSDCLEAERKPLSDEENKKKYGEDYLELKPQQQEDRKLVANNWDKARKKPAYWRSKHCNYCDLGFKWDKNSEYLDAEEKCQQELDQHKNSCSLKNDKVAQEKKKQAEWDKDRKSTVRVFLTCKKCKGKISYDKSIEEYKTARKQTLSDLSHHNKKECGVKPKEDWIIEVSYSPSQGGKRHAPIDNSLNENDFIFEKDNEGKVYQEQNPSQTPKGLSGGVITLLIIGGIVLVGGLIFLLTRINRKNKK